MLRLGMRVFGSVARGDHVGTSDVDVLIVLRDGELEDALERIRAFYPYFELPIGVDLLVHRRKRLEQRLESGDPFVRRMWEESEVL
jgi:predicted nucleotidyltransferase